MSIVSSLLSSILRVFKRVFLNKGYSIFSICRQRRLTETVDMSFLENLVQLEALAEEQPSGSVLRCTNFDPEKDATKLREAVRGLGTDEKTIINILSCRRNKQRQQIKNVYKQCYGRDLKEDLEADTSGDFGKLVSALMVPPKTYDCINLRASVQGIGTNEISLSEIMCSRDNHEMRQIRAQYKNLYKIELEDDLKADTSGNYQRLLVSLCNADRDETTEVNLRRAEEDAKILYDSGEGRMGTDESAFNLVFAKRSYAQLRATFSEYYRLGSKDIVESIKSEFSGDIRDALLAIVECARCKPAFFAHRLNNAMHGLGTDDDALIRIIVSRSEVDMTQIKKAFSIMYQNSLSEWIEGDTSGDYRKLLLELI